MTPLLQKQLERLISEKFDFMIEQGIKDKLWTEFERPAFKFVEKSIKDDIKSFLSECHKETIESIIEMAERMINDGPDKPYPPVDDDSDMLKGWDFALSDFIASLKELKWFPPN